MTPAPIVHVAVAAIVNEYSEVLISLRPQHVHQGGLWEFPGGKLESGESFSEALRREIHEELGITPIQFRPLIRVFHHYSDKSVLLDVSLVSKISGHPTGREGQKIQWVPIKSLDDYAFPTANLPVIRALQLPPYYLVTPDPDMDNLHMFFASLQTSLRSHVKLVQLRAKGLNDIQYATVAKEVVALCRASGVRVLLNADPEILNNIDADGIHLTSTRLQETLERPIASNKLLSVSCHTEADITQACSLRADLGLLSPVKHTTSHPDAAPLGWQQFQTLSDQADFPVYALGGMTIMDLADAHKHGGQGIAAISGLWGNKNGV